MSLNHLSDKEIRALNDIALLDGEYGRRSLRNYCEVVWPRIEGNRPYISGAWHSDCIADHLEAVYKKEITHLAIAIPPGHGKSTWACVFFPTYIWIHNPSYRSLFGSYGYDLATRDGLKCLNLMRSAWWQRRFGGDWAFTMKTQAMMVNSVGGHRAAVSVIGASLGKRGDLICADDALKQEEALSEISRGTCHRWWDGTMESRVDKNGCRIIIQQRLHDDDLIGHVLDEEGLAKDGGLWEYLCLPAEYEPIRRCFITATKFQDPREKEGEILFPECFDANYMAMKKKKPSWDPMYRQDPVPAGGAIIKKDWFRFYSEPPKDIYNACSVVLMSVDSNVKKKEGSSFTVIQIWGKIGPNIYLIDQMRLKLSFTGQLEAFNTMLAKWPRCGAKLIEDKATGPDLIDQLQKKVSGLIPFDGNDDKEERVEAISWMWQAGNVYVPGRPPKAETDKPGAERKPDFTMYPWMEEWYEEITRFPHAKYNDQVVSMSQAMIYFSRTMVNPDAMPSGVSIGGGVSELREMENAGRRYY